MPQHSTLRPLRLPLLAAPLAGILLLAGCSGGGDSGSGGAATGFTVMVAQANDDDQAYAKTLEAYGKEKGIDIEEVLAKARALCLPVSPRVISETDSDRLLVTSVNVPFANRIDSEGLAEVIRTGRIPPGYRGHIERFLGEIPLSRLLAFFDRHHIDTSTVAKFVLLIATVKLVPLATVTTPSSP